MYLRFLTVVSIAVLAVFLSSSRRSGEAGSRTVQLVYESDTRGYYLPCG
jgi:hypothetical protein